MNSKLNSKQQEIVLDNRELVNYLINEYKLARKYCEFEDITSIGTIGLIKAAITFDSSKDIAFSTYASRCILNEIYYFCMSEKKYANDISLYKPIAENREGHKFFFEEIIEDPKSDFAEQIANESDFIDLFNIVINCLNEKQRYVLLYVIGGKLQKDIANKLRITQAGVSKIAIQAAQKSRSNLGKFGEYKKVYSLGIEEYKYKLTFSSKDVCECDDLLWQTLKEMADEFCFKVKRDKEQITICTPADQEFFCIIAEVIWRIEDLSM